MPASKLAEPQSDEIDLDEHLQETKKIIFKLFNYYNKRIQALPKVVIYLLNLMEFLQLLYFLMMKDLKIYEGQGVVVDVLLGVAKYANGFSVVKEAKGVENFVMVVMCFGVMVWTMGMGFYSYKKVAKTKTFAQLVVSRNIAASNISLSSSSTSQTQPLSQSKFQTFLLNSLIFTLLLLHTILTIPTYSTLFPAFYCTPETPFRYSFLQTSQCYDILHLFVIFLAFLSLVILITVKMACLLLFYERNPFKADENLFACESSIPVMCLQGLKVLIVWYFIIDPKLEFRVLYMGGVVVVMGWFVVMFRWQQVGFYNRNYMRFQLMLEFMALLLACNNIIQYFIPTSTSKGISFIQFIIGALMLAYCSTQVLQHTRGTILNRFYSSPQQTKKSPQVQLLVSELIRELLYEPNQEKRLINTKLLLKQLDLEPGGRVAEQEKEFVDMVKVFLTQKDSAKMQRMVVVSYLRILIQQIIQNRPGFWFQGCRCALLFQYGLKTKALCQIYKLQIQKLSWVDEFFLYQIKQRNCNSMMEEEVGTGMGETTVVGFEEVDQEKIVIYDQYIQLISTLQQKIAYSISLIQQFWQQLTEDHPDFTYLTKLSSKLKQNHSQIQKCHKTVGGIFQNSIKQKFLYFSYLQTLQLNKQHAEQMNQFLQDNEDGLRSDDNSKKLILETVLKDKFPINFQENEKLVMIELEFTSNEGTIKNCNSEVYSFLGYAKDQIIGRRVDKIMPQIIAQKHNKFVENFINRKQSISKSSQRIVYAVHKSKFLVPGFLTIKMISNEEKGLKLVAFVRPLSLQPRTFSVLTSAQDSIVIGVTKEILWKVKDEDFINDIKQQRIYMEMLFPKLKVNSLEAGQMYEAEMATFNNIENQLMEEKTVSVQLRYELRTYQQNLQLKYYFVRFTKPNEYLTTGSPLTLKDMDTCHEFPLGTFNTTKMIENFTSRQSMQKRTKIQQLCRYKENYCSKHSEVKYYLCVFVFLAFFILTIGLNVMGFHYDQNFLQIFRNTKGKLFEVNALAKDVAVVEGLWVGKYIDGDNVKDEEIYRLETKRFGEDFRRFREYVGVSADQSIFNLKILQPASQPPQPLPKQSKFTQKLRTIYDFQTSALQLDHLKQNPSLSLITLNILMKSTKQLLQTSIDRELVEFLHPEEKFTKTRQMKLMYELVIVGGLVGFVVGLLASVKWIAAMLDKNLSMLRMVMVGEVMGVVAQLGDYLKIFVNSHSQEAQQTIVRMSRDNLSTQSNFTNAKRKSGQPHHNNKLFSDDNSLNNYLPANNIFHNPLSPTQPKAQDLPRSKILSSLKNPSKKPSHRESDHISDKESDLKKLIPPQGFRSGTALAKVSWKDVGEGVVGRGVREVGEVSSFGGMERGGKKARRISFVNDSELLGLQLSFNVFSQQSQQHIILPHNSFTSQEQINSRKALTLKQPPQRQSKKLSLSKSKSFIALEHNARDLGTVLVCVLLLLSFVGAKYLFYSLQSETERVLVQAEESVNVLVKTAVKMMYLRSVLKPYFYGFRDEGDREIVQKDTLLGEIQKLQAYTTAAFPQIEKQNQLILKNIYSQITLYLHIVTTYPAASQASLPPQLLSSISLIQSQLLNRHSNITSLLTTIKTSTLEPSQTRLLSLYLIQLMTTVALILINLSILYYKILFKLAIDQKATFWFVEFMPLRLMLNNRNLFKMVKKQANKE